MGPMKAFQSFLLRHVKMVMTMTPSYLAGFQVKFSPNAGVFSWVQLQPSFKKRHTALAWKMRASCVNALKEKRGLHISKTLASLLPQGFGSLPYLVNYKTMFLNTTWWLRSWTHQVIKCSVKGVILDSSVACRRWNLTKSQPLELTTRKVVTS